MRIQPVVLCGGSGTRLWPLSREQHPKQLAEIHPVGLHMTASLLPLEARRVDNQVLDTLCCQKAVQPESFTACKDTVSRKNANFAWFIIVRKSPGESPVGFPESTPPSVIP